MPFSDEVVARAWNNAGGKCQCRRITHDHSFVICGKELTWSNRGRSGKGAWKAYHIKKTDGDSLFNCLIICLDCYRKTL